MKILFIAGSLNQGGAEYQILEFAKLFKDNGHEIEVFALTNYDFYRPYINKNEIAYNHLYNHQSKIKRVFLTAKKIRKENPDLIVSYLKVPSQVALFAKLLSGKKMKLIVGERTSEIRPKYDKFHFNLMSWANHITVNSLSKLKYLQNRFPSIKNKTTFFPNIIDIKKFNFINKNYDSKLINIGFVGRISPEKNIINIIRAVKNLFNENISINLLIYGDARNKDYLNEVKKTISNNNLQNIVFLKGRFDNVNDVYNDIDLLCLISDYEGFSNVIAESISSGLPVITSDIPENKYLIENGINGFVVNQKDTQSIANGIKQYIDMSKDLKLKMAMTNRDKAEQIFDKKKIYNKYMNLILSL